MIGIWNNFIATTTSVCETRIPVVVGELKKENKPPDKLAVYFIFLVEIFQK